MTRIATPAARAANPGRTATRRKPVPRKPTARRGFQHYRRIGEETWLTPRWLVDALGLPRTADVDPCAPPVRHWATARLHFNKAQDGYNCAWRKSDFYWVNPPHGRECAKWMEKLDDHGNGLLLIFARTDTLAFHDLVFAHPGAHTLFFFHGRLKFANGAGEEVGTAGGPSVLAAYCRRAVSVIQRAMRAGALEGHLLVLER